MEPLKRTTFCQVGESMTRSGTLGRPSMVSDAHNLATIWKDLKKLIEKGF